MSFNKKLNHRRKLLELTVLGAVLGMFLLSGLVGQANSQGVSEVLYTEIHDSEQWLMVTDLTGNRKTLLTGNVKNKNPVFSSSGDMIAVSRRGSGDASIWVGDYNAINRTASSWRTIPGTGRGDEPFFHPNGVDVLYTQWISGDKRLVITDLSGNKATLLAGGAPNSHPVFSSNGDIIAVSRRIGDGDDSQSIWIGDYDATNRTASNWRTIPGTGRGHEPFFHPNGVDILYTKIQGSEKRLMVTDLTGNQKTLLSGSIKNNNPVFSSNGDMIAASRRVGSNDESQSIWVGDYDAASRAASNWRAIPNTGRGHEPFFLLGATPTPTPCFECVSDVVIQEVTVPVCPQHCDWAEEEWEVGVSDNNPTKSQTFIPPTDDQGRLPDRAEVFGYWGWSGKLDQSQTNEEHEVQSALGNIQCSDFGDEELDGQWPECGSVIGDTGGSPLPVTVQFTGDDSSAGSHKSKMVVKWCEPQGPAPPSQCSWVTEVREAHMIESGPVKSYEFFPPVDTVDRVQIDGLWGWSGKQNQGQTNEDHLIQTPYGSVQCTDFGDEELAGQWLSCGTQIGNFSSNITSSVPVTVEFNGDDSSVGSHLSRVEVSWCEPDPGETVRAWHEVCTSSYREISGVGMGSAVAVTNPQSSDLDNPGEVVQVIAQVAGMQQGQIMQYSESNLLVPGTEVTVPAPSSVTFTSNNNSTIVTDITPAERSWSFEGMVEPSSSVNAELSSVGSESFKTPRGLVLYSKRNAAENWTSVGRITHGFVDGGCDVMAGDVCGSLQHTEEIKIPTLIEDTDIYVSVAVIDNGNDDRVIGVTATAGNVTAVQAESTATDGDELNIFKLSIEDVPAGTDHVTVTLDSPEQFGESAALVGLNVSYPCAGSDSIPFAARQIKQGAKQGLTPPGQALQCFRDNYSLDCFGDGLTGLAWGVAALIVLGYILRFLLTTAVL